MALALLFGLLTALANAAALITQHIASTRSLTPPRGIGFVVFLVRQPLWLAGWLALAGSLVFQTLALHFGPLSLVQPLLVGELVLALLIRRLCLGQAISGRAWTAAALTSVGLAAFLLIASPSAGANPSTTRWIWSGLLCVAVVVVAVGLGWRGRPARRAAGFALATAVLWAAEATLIKAVGDQWSQLGVGGLVTHWPLYLFIVVGVAGLLCEQTALHVGPLGVSQPVIVLADPLASVVLGISLFNESLRSGLGPRLAIVLLLAVTGWSALELMRQTPDTMKATPNERR